MHKPPNHSNDDHLLLKSNLKQLRLPIIGSEFEKLAREAAIWLEDTHRARLGSSCASPARSGPVDGQDTRARRGSAVVPAPGLR